MSEGAEPAPATRAWFGVKLCSVYEPLDEPIAEFVDRYVGFVPNWMGIERSVFLVSGRDHDDACRILEEHVAELGPCVNVFGQSIRQRVLTLDSFRMFEFELAPREEQTIAEVFYELWSVTGDTDPVEFLDGQRPAPDRGTPMIAPISLCEHLPRYEELRGPLPA